MKKLPEGWKVVNLEDVATKMRSGGTPKSTNEEYYKGDIPFVKIDDITSCNKFLLDTKTKISKEALNNSSAWLVPEGAILYSMYASLGFLAINKIPVATNQAIMNIIPDTTTIDMEYLYQFLLDIKNKINKFVDQTTQKNLNAQKVRKFKIHLPPLEEQKKIAEILSTVDQKITLVDNQIEETELLKKGLMQKLLTEGIGHSEFKDSEVGRIPVEWEVVELKKYSDIYISNVDKKTVVEEKSVRLCNYMDTYNNSYITNNLNFMQSTASTLQIEKFSLQIGDIMITKDSETKSDIARSAVVIESLDNVLCGYHLALIRPYKNQFDSIFLKKLFDLEKLRKHLISKANGTTRFGLNVGVIENFLIPQPPLEEQKQIAKILSTTDEKLENLKAKKESFEELKKGLIQKLLTGEVRVKI